MTSETMEIVLGCMEFIKFLVGSHTTVRRNAGASVFLQHIPMHEQVQSGFFVKIPVH